MFILLGISLLLAALLGFNSLAALFTAVLWRIAGRFTHHWTAINQARVLFWLRVLPTGLGAAFVLILVVPSYLEFEPRSTNETVSLSSIIAAARQWELPWPSFGASPRGGQLSGSLPIGSRTQSRSLSQSLEFQRIGSNIDFR
jgi:hypothetical protein